MKTRIDTDIDCYSPEHGKWIAILGLPILIIWVIAMPLSALIFLYKKTRAGTESNMVTEYFLILYQGLKIKHFYWEFVNSLRKVCILISFALPTSGQIMFALLILLVTWRLQDFLKPYKRKQNNSIEIFGINISIITLCCGLIFNQDKTLKSLNNILLTIMVIFNILFILKWLHLLFLTLGAKHAFFKNVACVLRYLSLERSEDQFANLDFPKDSTVEPHKTLKKRKSKRRHTKTKEENKEESYRKRYKKKSSRGRRIRKKLLPRGGSKMMMKIREQQTDMRMLSSK